MRNAERRQLVRQVSTIVGELDPQRFQEVLAIAAAGRIADREPKEALADKVSRVIGELAPEEYHEILEIVAMRRPWRPKHTGWVNVLDQTLHAVYAMVVFLPLVAWPSYWTAAVSGFILGGLREVEQFRNWDLRIPMLWDRLQDAVFFALGALLLYHFIAA